MVLVSKWATASVEEERHPAQPTFKEPSISTTTNTNSSSSNSRKKNQPVPFTDRDQEEFDRQIRQGTYRRNKHGSSRGGGHNGHGGGSNRHRGGHNGRKPHDKVSGISTSTVPDSPRSTSDALLPRGPETPAAKELAARIALPSSGNKRRARKKPNVSSSNSTKSTETAGTGEVGTAQTAGADDTAKTDKADDLTQDLIRQFESLDSSGRIDWASFDE